MKISSQSTYTLVVIPLFAVFVVVLFASGSDHVQRFYEKSTSSGVVEKVQLSPDKIELLRKQSVGYPSPRRLHWIRAGRTGDDFIDDNLHQVSDEKGPHRVTLLDGEAEASGSLSDIDMNGGSGSGGGDTNAGEGEGGDDETGSESVTGREPIAYDATDHAGKPADPPARMGDVQMTSRWWFLDHECGPNDTDGSCTADSATLRETHYRRALRGDHGPGAANARRVVLNLEEPGWETGGWERENGDKPSLMSKTWKQQAREAMRRWARALRIAHQELPEAEIGVYRMFPIRNYWAPVKYERRHNKEPFNRWRNANSFLAGEEVTYRVNGQRYRNTIPDLIDFVSPSLYEFYPRPERWEVYAKHNLDEAEKFGSDVRPFIWATYHPGGSASGPLPENHWRRIVSFIGNRGYPPIVWNSDDSPWPDGGPMWYNVLVDELGG